METSDLTTFLAVADRRSFSAAAGDLDVTQPAVSKRIQALESRLGTRLFDRVGKQTFLTNAGRVLVPRAKQLLLDLDDTERAIANLSGAVAGPLRLATSHHIGLHRLAPVLRAFARSHPEVHLDVRFVDSEIAHDLLHRGEVELAVVTLDPKGATSLEYRTLWQDPLEFAAAADHDLNAPGEHTLAALMRHPAVLPGLSTYTGRIVTAMFEREKLPLAPAMSTNYLETLRMLVSIGLGWSVLPATMLDREVVALDVAAPAMRRSLGCVLDPTRTLSNTASAFVEVLQSYADR